MTALGLLDGGDQRGFEREARAQQAREFARGPAQVGRAEPRLQPGQCAAAGRLFADAERRQAAFAQLGAHGARGLALGAAALQLAGRVRRFVLEPCHGGSGVIRRRA
ncbi:hypothetical protein D3C85_1336120 [compost metagenome]